MTDDRPPRRKGSDPAPPPDRARRERAAQALRDNLRRRKARTAAQSAETAAPGRKGPPRGAP